MMEQAGIASALADVEALVPGYLAAWKRKVEALCGENSEVNWPPLSLDKFLLRPTDDLYASDRRGLETKVANKSTCFRKKGKTGTAWERLHKSAYEKMGVASYTSAELRGEDYTDNIFFQALPTREKDVILYWDLCEPLPHFTGGDVSERFEQELTTSALVSTYGAQLLLYSVIVHWRLELDCLPRNDSRATRPID